MKLKAVFLDKDGTIIPDFPYNVDTSKTMLAEGVVEGLQLLQSNGYLLVIVSNQDGLAYGYYTLEEVQSLKETLSSLCLKMGIYLDGFYYCPHHPESDCKCRKPEPGLLYKAAGDMDIDLSESWMIGDIVKDMEAGNRAGCKTVLIDNGTEPEWMSNRDQELPHKAKDLAEAARYILSASNKSSTTKKTGRQKKYAVPQAG